MSNTTNQIGDQRIMDTIKEYESQIGANIKKLANEQEIYNLPYDSLISILDSTEPLDTTTVRIMTDKIKFNYSEEKSSKILPHLKISNENAKNLCNQLSSIISKLNDKTPKKSNKNDMIQLFVKTLTGKHITIRININETVSTLKKLVESRTIAPADELRLTYNGICLENEMQLKHYGIIAVLSLKG